MEELCEQLDQKVLEIFDALEDIYKTQAQLEEVMKTGYLGISRARYSLGVKRISSDQFVDAELSAIHSVKITESSNPTSDSRLPSDSSDWCKPLFELCNNVEHDGCDEESKEEIKGKENEKSGEEGLRRRNVDSNLLNSAKDRKSDKGNTSGTKKDKMTDESQESSEEGKKTSRKSFNPISLFGVLVPQTLRSSQKDFEEAVRLAVTVANMKSKLSQMQLEYKELLEKKKKVKPDGIAASKPDKKTASLDNEA